MWRHSAHDRGGSNDYRIQVLARGDEMIEQERRLPPLARLRHPAMSVLRSLWGDKRTSRGRPISVVIDPERTLIAEERPRQRGSEHGLRAGDAELNRCHLRRAKFGS